MQKKVVSALVIGAWATFPMSGCSSGERNFGKANGGAQNAGASGGGAQARAGSNAAGSDADGGRRAFAGMGGADDGSGAASGEAGAASGEAGAGGEAGAFCQGSDCDSCADARNACGGCAKLVAAPDSACGECGKYECAADKESVTCKDPGKNACGGCSAIAGTLGASCGACSVTACASDRNSLVCNSQCTGAQVCVSGLNQCKTADCSAPDSCGKSDGAGSTCSNAKGNCLAKPNSTGQCSGASCAYTCKTKTLSCSTAAEPACGSWNFESKTAEGWYVDTTTWGVNDAADKTKGLYLAAPPGSGAGSYSLALDVDGSTGKSGTTILVALCPGSTAAKEISGKFHASVWWKPSDNKGGLGGPGYAYTLPGGGGTDTNCPAGTWFDVPTQPIAGANITHVGVSIGGIDGHKGTLYFDNIYFE